VLTHHPEYGLSIIEHKHFFRIAAVKRISPGFGRCGHIFLGAGKREGGDSEQDKGGDKEQKVFHAMSPLSNGHEKQAANLSTLMTLIFLCTSLS
jgi:hypothetical protein